MTPFKYSRRDFLVRRGYDKWAQTCDAASNPSASQYGSTYVGFSLRSCIVTAISSRVRLSVARTNLNSALTEMMLILAQALHDKNGSLSGTRNAETERGSGLLYAVTC